MSKAVSYPVKKLISLSTDQIERISYFRHENRIASETEAIRRLIDIGLQVAVEKKR